MFEIKVQHERDLHVPLFYQIYWDSVGPIFSKKKWFWGLNFNYLRGKKKVKYIVFKPALVVYATLDLNFIIWIHICAFKVQ